jgi:2-keto-4-pentenoate hydratase/2-oxohepta-3-ene-1,7-dioic acid hydratase in catechol pathway
MRIGNLGGRLVLVRDDLAIDVETASQGRFSSDPQRIYARFQELREWADSASLPAGEPFQPADLGSPAPSPGQVFAIGLNYRSHAEESGFQVPDEPTVFTKFPSSITGPLTDVPLPDGNVDWEVELVVVLGRRASSVPSSSAWGYVAGLTVGQDLSERRLQLGGPVPQFSLAKSYPGFSPMGPTLVTVDEFADPDDLELTCSIDGQEVQRARTSDLIFSVPELIARLSHVLTLEPGDVIFTGTPAGVGAGRKPTRFLHVGEVLTSEIEGIGQLQQTFVPSRTHAADPASR